MHFAPARKASEMSIERKMAFPINVRFIKYEQKIRYAVTACYKVEYSG